jgi:hypothetical protein
VRSYRRFSASWAPLSLLLAIALAAPAVAHQGFTAGRAAFLSADGELTGAGTTWGVVFKEDDGTWQRVCEESIGQLPAFYHQLPGGRVVVGTAVGLLGTDDKGCNWTSASPALDGRVIASLGVGVDDPTRLFIATSTAEGDNGIFRSTDGGLTFTATPLSASPLAFRTVLPDPAGARVWATSIDLEAQVPHLFFSSDGGDTFNEINPGWAVDTQFVTLVGFNERTDEVAVVQVDGTGETTLEMMDPAGTTLRSVVTEIGTISDYVATKLHEYIIINRQVLKRRTAGDGDFVDAVGPVQCLSRVPGDPRHLWGCGLPFQGGHFLRTLDGVNFKPKLPFLDVLERECPAESDGAICEQFRDPGNNGGFSAFGAPPPGPPPGCDQAGGGHALWLLALGLMFIRRRA